MISRSHCACQASCSLTDLPCGSRHSLCGNPLSSENWPFYQGKKTKYWMRMRNVTRVFPKANERNLYLNILSNKLHISNIYGCISTQEQETFQPWLKTMNYFPKALACKQHSSAILGSSTVCSLNTLLCTETSWATQEQKYFFKKVKQFWEIIQLFWVSKWQPDLSKMCTR